MNFGVILTLFVAGRLGEGIDVLWEGSLATMSQGEKKIILGKRYLLSLSLHLYSAHVCSPVYRNVCVCMSLCACRDFEVFIKSFSITPPNTLKNIPYSLRGRSHGEQSSEIQLD